MAENYFKQRSDYLIKRAQVLKTEQNEFYNKMDNIYQSLFWNNLLNDLKMMSFYYLMIKQ